MEINELRPFFAKAMHVVGKLTVELPGEGGANDDYAFEDEQEDGRRIMEDAPAAPSVSKASTSAASSHPASTAASTRWGTGEWGR